MAISPRRLLPKRNSGPTHTSFAFNLRTSTCSTKSSALIELNAALKRSKPTASQPNVAKPSNLARGNNKRGGGKSFEKNSRGKGSKLKATNDKLAARARRRVCSIRAWCPRCRPSNAPIQTTLPAGPITGWPVTSRNKVVIA